MKTIELFYQETEIHFLVYPTNDQVMVNATEMAKLFNKRTKDYLKTQSTKDFIEALKRALIGAQIIDDRGRNGIYFDRRLALDFATWLDVDFRVWIFKTMDDIIFGNYKKHWEAHAAQEAAKIEMESLKTKMLTEPNIETSRAYFEAERIVKDSSNAKRRAINSQYNLFKS